MPDAGLGDGKVELSRAGQHFRINEEPASIRQQFEERFLAKHLQSAIAIADPRAHQRPDEHVITPGIDSSLSRGLSIDSITDGQVMSLLEAEQERQALQGNLTAGIG